MKMIPTLVSLLVLNAAQSLILIKHSRIQDRMVVLISFPHLWTVKLLKEVPLLNLT